MRVLQVCSAKGIGGGEVHVADLALGLLERGIDVEMAIRPSSRLPDLVAERGDAGADLVWHRLPFRNALDLTSIRGIARIVERNGVDVVHAHVARDYPVAAMATASDRRGALVITRHHYLPIKSNVLYRRLLGRASIITVSESVRQTVAESLRVDPESIAVVHNWIDLDRHASPRDRASERHAYGIKRRVAVGIVGQLTPLKGQEEFLRAAAQVVATRGDVEFLIVGEDGEAGSPFKRRLERRVAELGLGEWVRFLGFQQDLPGLFTALDAVAVPSWNEAFSLVAAEAMAAGRPVIASRVGGLVEVVEDELSGILVPVRDPDALAKAILRLAADPALAEMLGARARESARRFARGPGIDAIVEVYRRALARG